MERGISGTGYETPKSDSGLRSLSPKYPLCKGVEPSFLLALGSALLANSNSVTSFPRKPASRQGASVPDVRDRRASSKPQGRVSV